MISQLLLLALGTLVSEDLACLAAGALVAQGRLSYIAATLACVTGILAGDLALFMAGRFAGPRLLRWPLLSRWLPQARVDHAARWLNDRGLMVILLSRFTPGLRLPTYFAAGMLPTRFAPFVLYLFVAASVWTPLLVGSVGWARGSLPVVILSLAALAGARALFRWTNRRRVVGFLMSKLRWEFWPAWAAYLPVVPYFLLLAIRHRSLTLFTAANPGIPSGGLAGESKSQILAHLSKVPGAVAGFRLLRGVSGEWQFPVVLKPDVGERGQGVAVIRSPRELDTYLATASQPLIVQDYVEGLEFGVFYCRYPNEPAGRILSITEKRFPAVTGDGVRTLRELILKDSRAVCMARTYEQLVTRPLDEVPAKGEPVQLVELGSHCRGAIFLDGSHLKTASLEAAIDRISKAHPGFYFGRFDIRASSREEFQEGRGFKVIELNGVAGEATHIYDPAVSLIEAYRVMMRHWRIAFEIGARNRDRGCQPMTVCEVAHLVLIHWRRTVPSATALPAPQTSMS